MLQAGQREGHQRSRASVTSEGASEQFALGRAGGSDGDGLGGGGVYVLRAA